MEAQPKTDARSSPTVASSSKQNGDHIQEEDLNLRRRTATRLSTDNVIDPTPRESPIELVSRAQTPEETTEVLPTAVRVPRSQRRGIFARATILAEIEDPYQYSYQKKWFIVFVVAYAAAAAPMGSAVFFPSLSQVAAELHTTPTVVNLTIAFYMLSLAIAPLFWSSLSEQFGRRSILLISLVLFIVFAILSAESTSIVMLTFMRVLCGGAAASVQAVGAGTVADIWKPIERGRAVGFFYLGPLCGPLFAPVIGGALAQRWRWRAPMWFLAIYGGTTFLLLLLALPETLKKTETTAGAAEEQESDPPPAGSPHCALSRTSTREDVHSRAIGCMRMLRICFVDPLKSILYLRFPAILLTVYYASITFAALYFLNISIQTTFAKPPYGFSILVIGFLYVPAALGYVIASLGGGKWMDRIMAREAKKEGRFEEGGLPIYRPEDRMRENAWVGAIVYPLSLIVYGWTAEKGTHWILSMIALFFFGLGSMIIFSLATTMLTEFSPESSSAGVAVNVLMRNSFSVVATVVAGPLITVIGNGWLFTILGLLTLASASVVWSMKHYGPRWRVAMDKSASI